MILQIVVWRGLGVHVQLGLVASPRSSQVHKWSCTWTVYVELRKNVVFVTLLGVFGVCGDVDLLLYTEFNLFCPIFYSFRSFSVWFRRFVISSLLFLLSSPGEQAIIDNSAFASLDNFKDRSQKSFWGRIGSQFFTSSVVKYLIINAIKIFSTTPCILYIKINYIEWYLWASTVTIRWRGFDKCECWISHQGRCPCLSRIKLG